MRAVGLDCLLFFFVLIKETQTQTTAQFTWVLLETTVGD